MEYYNQDIKQVLNSLDSSLDGISQDKAKELIEKNGYNEISEGKKKSTFVLFLEQFKELLVIILIIAAAISFVLGEEKSAITICVVLILNAILGVVQTKKAESSLNGLKKLSAPTAKVIRNGDTIEIEARELVVGDIVVLDAGDYIPADGRIIESSSLQVIESSLTGESTAVDKNKDVVEKEEVPIGDRSNMVFSSGLVTYGRGKFVVTGTGMGTEIGKIANLIETAKERKTPLQERLDDFSKKLGIAVMIVAAIVFGLNMIRGAEFVDAFMFAVALAVAAIPEALSSIVTIVLAVGTNKMAEHNAIVKKLPSVETLGAASIICSDKTGTLTQNKMTVVHTFTMDGEDVDIKDGETQETLVGISLLANDSKVTEEGKEIGDPTETALINYGATLGRELKVIQAKYERLADIPFDSDRKLMSTLHDFNGKSYICTKGAPDVLLRRTNRVMINGEFIDITDEYRNKIAEQNDAYSEQGLRVLAFGMTELTDDSLDLLDEKDYIFVGLMAMIDPARPEVADAILRAKNAGVKTIMITGDHKVTARAIAKNLGIIEDGDIAIDAIEFDAMSEEEYLSKLDKISVYARVSPEHKIRIVQAWQERGKIVAMTGDGVNDAPALKQADIGIAMGITGTDVSKDAAAMVLADDNFATIVEAISQGRGVYANIKKAIQFLLAGNLGGIITVFVAALFALPNPFTALQLLFINLVTDSLPAIALAFEPAEKGLMDEKPRKKDESIFAGGLIGTIGIQGTLLAIVTLAAFFIGLKTGGTEIGQTMAFITLCMARLFYGFFVRGKAPVIKLGLLTNKFMLYAVGIGLVMIALVLYVPFVADIFQVTSIGGMELLYIVILSLIPFLVMEISKFFRKKK